MAVNGFDAVWIVKGDLD